MSTFDLPASFDLYSTEIAPSIQGLRLVHKYPKSVCQAKEDARVN